MDRRDWWDPRAKPEKGYQETLVIPENRERKAQLENKATQVRAEGPENLDQKENVEFLDQQVTGELKVRD